MSYTNTYHKLMTTLTDAGFGSDIYERKLYLDGGRLNLLTLAAAIDLGCANIDRHYDGDVNDPDYVYVTEII
jgi:hypothetical protein